MAITPVGASQGAVGVPVSLARTAGAINNLLVVGALFNGSPTAMSISDTQGNTWFVANVFRDDATNNGATKSWYAFAKNTSSTTITVTATGGAPSFGSMTLDEFTAPGTISLDQTAISAVGSSGTPISPSFTPTANDELIWTYCADSITAVGNIDGSAATKGGDDGAQDWSEFRVLVGRSGVSMTAAFTGSGGYDLIVATFQETAAGAAGQGTISRGFHPGRGVLQPARFFQPPRGTALTPTPAAGQGISSVRFHPGHYPDAVLVRPGGFTATLAAALAANDPALVITTISALTTAILMAANDPALVITTNADLTAPGGGGTPAPYDIYHHYS